MITSNPFLSLLTILSCCHVSSVPGAVHPEALFFSASSFVTNKPDVEYHSDQNNFKIRTRIPFNRRRVSVSYSGYKQSFQKQDLYGYRDHWGFNYRFVDGVEFLIEDTVGRYRYVLQPAASSKRLQNMAVKKYESLSAGSQIYIVTGRK